MIVNAKILIFRNRSWPGAGWGPPASPRQAIIVDAKSMHDAMGNEPSGVGMKEKRTGYEMQMIKESAKKSFLDARWANSDAQLADA